MLLSGTGVKILKKLQKSLKFIKENNTKLSFLIKSKHRIEVDLPSLGKRLRKTRKFGKNRIRTFGNNKKRLMSPPVVNKNKLKMESPENIMNCKEEDFLIYSIFRQNIQEGVLKTLVSDVAQGVLKENNIKPKIRRGKNKSALKGSKIDPKVFSNLKYNPNNLKLMKLKELVNKDYDLQKKTMRKKKMLDLMIRRKLSPKKKKIIQTYGKDMIAEMYLDLINLSEIKKKEFLTNFGNKRRGSNQILTNEFDDPSFQFVDKSMFNKAKGLQEGREINKQMNSSQGKSLFNDLKNSSIMDASRSRSVRSKSSKQRRKVRTNQSYYVSFFFKK